MDAGTWQWVWLGAVIVFAVCELFTIGLFFMVSFAIGATLAAVLAFLDFGLAVQWVAFIVGSAASLAVLVPFGRRADARAEGDSRGEGALRWVGRLGEVVEEIPAGHHNTGVVRVERTTWRAETGRSVPIPVGTTVRVVEVRGTRLVVTPTVGEGSPIPASEPDRSQP
jgi:membrane protein implicated in regulation of membrane protease activity